MEPTLHRMCNSATPSSCPLVSSKKTWALCMHTPNCCRLPEPQTGKHALLQHCLFAGTTKCDFANSKLANCLTGLCTGAVGRTTR